jgi:cytochrome b561
VAAIKAVDSDIRARSGGPPWLALSICMIGAAGLLHDAWPTALYMPMPNLHAVFGVMLWLMVLAQFRQAGRSALAPSGADMHELARRLSRAVFLQLYILFGMSQIVRIAVILSNSGQDASHKAILQPPENLRDYLAYGILALLTIHALALRQQPRSSARLRPS